MTATGLRERKKEATREALRHAAVTLYRERGPHAVTVEDICAKAGVSPRTFFNYFETKDEAVLALDVSAEALYERIVERPADEDPLTALRAVYAARFAELMQSETFRERTLLLREHPELAKRLTHSNKAFEETVARGIATRTGLPSEDIYVRTTAAAAFAANRSALVCWQPGSGPGLVALLHQAMDVLERGLTPSRPE
ncbi:AcrR family transcriptional regulator [Amycolatopsis bartoniae]|uniref:TetR family transcriptional regulator n=1 Tax=Amycolatopsis bartoniae TaxID=941986 RepID=A0A8H9IWC0_9PSEU|nr:TetR/AcrR family transcriptional regulator [Amycolatopsis bartoniae]MBB2933123.1 AcrR family transcriptional regulator [Amycolatopsis bartoniae]TVT11879.1 TetR family transcriptional regulator [Amycolatopsis bartoniae]GHF57247.1 TetR family transcriptional regulator [Amycolatopsis bartoniae]